MTQNIDDKYRHHNYLSAVAAHDASYVRGKDLSYGASWKQRGGVGAFMMLARKWDRLENILKGRTKQYDIFSNVGDGSDGTVLAEVRDLRQYLLLVECEMIARGVVQPPRDYSDQPPPAGATGGLTGTLLDQILQNSAAPERTVPRYPSGQHEVVTDDDMAASLAAEADGAGRDSMAPWAVNMRWRFNHDMQPGGAHSAEFDRWYRAVAPGVWALEPSVECSSPPPAPLQQCYAAVANVRRPYWIIAIEDVHQDARDWFPSLPLERTLTELEAMPWWQRGLYHYVKGKDEYRLTREAWHHADKAQAA